MKKDKEDKFRSLTNQAIDLLKVSVVLLLLTESQETEEWRETQRRDSPAPTINRHSKGLKIRLDVLSEMTHLCGFLLWFGSSPLCCISLASRGSRFMAMWS